MVSQKFSRFALFRIIIFIGDSHVVSLTDSEFDRSLSCKLSRIGSRYFLFVSLWFKDTLAYSVSKKRFPSNLKTKMYVLNLLRLVGAKYYFNFGEIDIRCHLAKEDKNIDFLPSYVYQCRKILKTNSKRIVFLTPTPPSDLYEDHPSFPRYGGMSERMKAYFDFCDNLRIAAIQQSCGFINLSHALVTGTSGLSSDLTDDGCHLNLKGASLVRELILNEA